MRSWVWVRGWVVDRFVVGLVGGFEACLWVDSQMDLGVSLEVGLGMWVCERVCEWIWAIIHPDSGRRH